MIKAISLFLAENYTRSSEIPETAQSFQACKYMWC